MRVRACSLPWHEEKTNVSNTHVCVCLKEIYFSKEICYRGGLLSYILPRDLRV